MGLFTSRNFGSDPISNYCHNWKHWSLMHVIQELCMSTLVQKFHFTQLEANVVFAARPSLARSKIAYTSAECKIGSLGLAGYGFQEQWKGHCLPWTERSWVYVRMCLYLWKLLIFWLISERTTKHTMLLQFLRRVCVRVLFEEKAGMWLSKESPLWIKTWWLKEYQSLLTLSEEMENLSLKSQAIGKDWISFVTLRNTVLFWFWDFWGV